VTHVAQAHDAESNQRRVAQNILGKKINHLAEELMSSNQQTNGEMKRVVRSLTYVADHQKKELNALQEKAERALQDIDHKVSDKIERLHYKQYRLEDRTRQMEHKVSDISQQERANERLLYRLDGLSDGMRQIGYVANQNNRGCFETMVDGVKDTGNALQSLGSGLNSIRRVVMPMPTDILSDVMNFTGPSRATERNSIQIGRRTNRRQRNRNIIFD